MTILQIHLTCFIIGTDLHVVDIEVPSSVMTFNISRLTMKPGVRYYSNVVITTLSGLQTTVSSDGIIVDSSPPVPGMVYDGIGNAIIIDYYMAFFISHVISTQDAHISSRAEGPRDNMGRRLIWHVI